jgi:hypothetical protein
MKIIVSSKHLQEQLSKIDFDMEDIKGITFVKGGFNFSTMNSYGFVRGEIQYNYRSEMRQELNRWDLILKLVSQIDDQPITLDIHEFKVEVIFNF